MSFMTIVAIESLFYFCLRSESEKPSANFYEDEKFKEMIYFMYNIVQQKEKIEKQSDRSESDTSSPDRSSGGSSSKVDSLVSSPGSLGVVSPGSRSSFSDNSVVSPYGLLQMVNRHFLSTTTHSLPTSISTLHLRCRIEKIILFIFRPRDQEGPRQLHHHPRLRSCWMIVL